MSSSSHILRAITMPTWRQAGMNTQHQRSRDETGAGAGACSCVGRTLTSPLEGLSPRLCTQLQVWQRSSGSVGFITFIAITTTHQPAGGLIPAVVHPAPGMAEELRVGGEGRELRQRLT
eukprot:5407495-Pyramimonas_sp.AAC.2